eukprot:g19019.t1
MVGSSGGGTTCTCQHCCGDVGYKDDTCTAQTPCQTKLGTADTLSTMSFGGCSYCIGQSAGQFCMTSGCEGLPNPSGGTMSIVDDKVACAITSNAAPGRKYRSSITRKEWLGVLRGIIFENFALVSAFVAITMGMHM